MANTKANATNTATVKMSPQKVTKNKIRFEEKLVSEFDPVVLDTIYVFKTTLGRLGFSQGKALEVTLRVVDED